ncbi:MAG: multidrug ABC transporter ATPase [Betaproteobacteria bacterium]|nr:multidrug ABC transporter ATPase [Betaproteobacteria bacterium]
MIAAAACKAMPNAPSTMIAVIAFDTNHEEREPVGTGKKTQVVALVEAGKVVAANRSTIIEDSGFAVGSYLIDTARYILSRDVRAFGVVLYSSAHGNRCFEAHTDEYLSLWIREGEHLRAIFGTNLYGWNSLDGPLDRRCTQNANDDDTVRTEEARMTIGVEKTSSHGFADLSITAHVTEHYSGDESVTGKRTVRKAVKYNGQSYGFNALRTFWWHPERRYDEQDRTEQSGAFP